MSNPTYRWDSPYEWLMEYCTDLEPSELLSVVQELAMKLDSDALQDLYQSEMDADGYFTPLRKGGRK